MGSTKANGVADMNTPLIRNCWYVAAKSDDLGEQLLDRWLLGQNVLLYRTEAGDPVAMDNRCPHRSFPLSQGKRTGDNVVCGYHGMTFAPDGRCTHFPPIAKTPRNIRTSAYPVVERAPLVWIWLGDPSKADPNLIPEHPVVEAGGWSTVGGYYHVKANYIGLQENLQDLSHFEHLHSSSVGTPGQDVAALDIEVKGEAIFSTRVYRDIVAPPLWQNALGLKTDRVTRTIAESCRSPAVCDALTTINGIGRDDTAPKDYHIRILHFITPERQHTTHYWWFFARDFAVDDAEADRLFKEGIGAAFKEDKDALEGISALCANDVRDDFQELSFASDKAGVLLRRHFYKLAHTEAEQII